MTSLRTRPRFESAVVSKIAALAVALIWVGFALPARAEVVATAALLGECDTTIGACCAEVTFDAGPRTFFTHTRDLAAEVGTVTTLDTVITAFTGLSGDFNGTFEAPDPLDLTYPHTGSFLCGASGCATSGSSFTGTLGATTGTSALPSGLTYTQDGGGTTVAEDVSPMIPGCSLTTVDRLIGTYTINAFQAENTPAGTDVIVETTTTFHDNVTGEGVEIAIDVKFADVSAGGTTTVTAFANSASTPPTNFAARIDGVCDNDPLTTCCADAQCPGGTCEGCFKAVFVDVSTDATISGPITVCGHYSDEDDDGFVDGTVIAEDRLSVLHDEGGPEMVDSTVSRDPVENIVCGEVSSLSLFVVAAGPGPDPFKCYKVADKTSPKFAKRTAALADQLAINDGDALLIKPFLVCNTTEIDGSIRNDPTAQMICYKLRGTRIPGPDKPTIGVGDQLGGHDLKVQKPFLLCVPAGPAP